MGQPVLFVFLPRRITIMSESERSDPKSLEGSKNPKTCPNTMPGLHGDQTGNLPGFVSINYFCKDNLQLKIFH